MREGVLTRESSSVSSVMMQTGDLNISTNGGNPEREQRLNQIQRSLQHAAEDAGIRSYDPHWRIKLKFETSVFPWCCVEARFLGYRDGMAIVALDGDEFDGATVRVPLPSEA